MCPGTSRLGYMSGKSPDRPERMKNRTVAPDADFSKTAQPVSTKLGAVIGWVVGRIIG